MSENHKNYPVNSTGKRYFVLDFETETVEKLTHAAFIRKADAILEENPRAKAELQELKLDLAAKSIPRRFTQYKERELYGKVLDPTQPWSRLHGVFADHQGLFITDRSSLAVMVAALHSDQFGQNVYEFSVGYSKRECDAFDDEVSSPSFQEDLGLRRANCFHYWQLLGEKRLLNGKSLENAPTLSTLLDRLKPEERILVREEAKSAINQEKRIRQSSEPVYYYFNLSMPVARQIRHDDLMRLGLRMLHDNPEALQRFALEELISLRKGVPKADAEAAALLNRLSPISQDWLIGIPPVNQRGIYFSKDPAEILAAATMVSPRITRDMVDLIAQVEGTEAVVRSIEKAKELRNSLVFKARWATFELSFEEKQKAALESKEKMEAIKTTGLGKEPSKPSPERKDASLER